MNESFVLTFNVSVGRLSVPSLLACFEIFAIIGRNLCFNKPASIMMLQRAQVLCPKLTAALFTSRQFHVSPICERVQAARYKITPKRDRPLTYEMANPPHFIGHRKAWNSWNVCE